MKINYVYYPRPYYFILPTIILCIHDGDIKWIIAIHWLRFMFTIAKFARK